MITIQDTIAYNCTDTSKKLLDYATRGIELIYNNPPRAYHNYTHVKECLTKLEEVSDLVTLLDRDIIAKALIYHDCIYDPQSKDNEKLSAERALLDLTAVGFSESYAYKVYDLILLTTHEKPCDYIAGQLIMDIDMSILGSPEEQFFDYEKKIRQEYSCYKTDDYIKGRSDFIRALQNKDQIFQTDYFRNKYEEVARANLDKLIFRLQELYKDEPIRVVEDRYYKKAGIEIHCYKCAFGADCLLREFSAACHHSFIPSRGYSQD